MSLQTIHPLQRPRRGLTKKGKTTGKMNYYWYKSNQYQIK